MSEMVVGALELVLVVREAQSLKDKRQAIKSLKDRLRHKFTVAVAEVGDLDSYQRAVLGVAAVGNDPKHVSGVLAKVVDFVRFFPYAELADYELRIL